MLRKERPDRKGLCPVELVVHSRGKRTRVATGIRVTPAQWDPKRARVRSTHPKVHELNRRLVAIESKAQAVEVDNPVVSVDRARVLLNRQKASASSSFADIVRANLERDQAIAYHTRRTWLSTLNKFESFAPGIRTEEVDANTVRNFHAHMRKAGISITTATSVVRRLRIMYRRACEDLGKDPVKITKSVILKEGTGTPRFVPQERVPELLTYANSRAIRRLAVDLWCFSYLVWGMRFQDLALLKWSDIDGQWLRLPQHKTDHDKRAKLDARSMAILERYRGGTYVFKVCGDHSGNERQRDSRLAMINEELRAVGRELGLPHALTTHTARHTFTEQALRMGFPWTTIMQMLGVKDMRSFAHYIASFNVAGVEEAAGKFSGK